ncbi:HD domain-containing protein [Vibrio sp. 404]|uniref:HD domain-containing protein n=1 Tax=Vibrio marinisediminis TaxID=2758441 RepID=A0A7W2FRJ4_9VIBR|nr:HD domain-containing phosphohydrolase [Vibrio marinisediminis]MBA5762986.1 HD domain-containing protein [Vibrio marinisediminis]
MLDYYKLDLIARKNKKFTSLTSDIFEYVRQFYPCLGRISLVTIDGDCLSTYHTEDIAPSDQSLEFEEIVIRQGSSIEQIISQSQYRIINNINQLPDNRHVQMLKTSGYVSSLAYPVVHHDKVISIIFFNSKTPHLFQNNEIKKDFFYVAQIIATLQILVFERQSHFDKLLTIALKIGHERDPETAQHLVRIGRYSEALARLLTKHKPEITTEFIHRIKCYAPFHDIGKYRIPDEVLFSTNTFSSAERAIMNKHTIYGEEIIANVVDMADLTNIPSEEVTFLKNIIRHHHEAFDGTGHPDGLSNVHIPLEARIVTLADVFDALLTKRPYKDPWTLDQVIEFVKAKSGYLFDPLCVQVLLENLDEMMTIRQTFADEPSEEHRLSTCV